LGLRLADKLFKVWRLDGEEAWVLIHVEVQNQAEEQFGERMYVYHYRIFDRFRRPVVSLAVLGDEQRGWRPAHFGYSLWGCSMRLEFPVVKLLDYADRVAELEAERNPFAAVVLAHLKTVERIIGYKRGTGGTSGVAYLAKALELRFFPELWSVRTSI